MANFDELLTGGHFLLAPLLVPSALVFNLDPLFDDAFVLQEDAFVLDMIVDIRLVVLVVVSLLRTVASGSCDAAAAAAAFAAAAN